ncbi:hypothetical protein OPV22_021167 [Ensete ventricosum]|uniref:H(+)-exporting diphosphatase n=1 Tax=Ensete ventricosum TaxID=4639 RepID=A0AAV8PAU6_ENSVE|nr:hypothetical protein OPV22_021167 [Ensete ventricosum]
MGAAAILSGLLTEIMIPAAAVVGIAFALDGVSDYLIEEEEGLNDHNVVVKCAEIQSAAISEGATSFLFTEYQYVGIFMVAFAVLIFLFLGSVEGFSTEAQPCAYSKDKYCKPALANAGFSTISFLLGATTSLVSGFLGMKIATYANARTTLEARKGVGKAFIIAFRSGAVMGFLVAANGFLVLYIAINLFKLYYGDDWEGLFESITGYGLGGSSMALFGRVGGGIYTKAADVGADLVGKVERDIPEDDPRNPAVIADNVGDNVGDIAGMGSDLFGSYAESSCAALVVASISSFGVDHDFTAMCYPLLSMGIIVCLITTLFATDFFEIKAVKEIEPVLKWQLIISTVLMTVEACKELLFFCVAIGLWAGLVIGFVTEYYTSNAYSPVQDVADSCCTGAATNVISGLALGYKSVIIAIFAIAVSIFVSFSLAAMYGIAAAALGMLSTIATGLAIDAYGPISDNAGGIAEMAGMSHRIRERTDALDAAGNTTAAIGKLPWCPLHSLVPLCLDQGNDSSWCSGDADTTYCRNLLWCGNPIWVLAGSLVSGVQIAISASNTGGAWDNAKKYIEAGASEHAMSLGPKGSDPHKAAVIGDTIGDPLKDTSGPSLNILIKLMAVESLVFAPFSATHGGLLFKIF